MAERQAKTEPFHGGGNTTAKGQPAQKVPVKSKMSMVRNAGQPDPLAQSFIAPPHVYANTVHFNYQGNDNKRRGYNPEGTYGTPKTAFKTKATNPMAGHGGRGTFRGNP
jgi:hypothetical protein